MKEGGREVGEEKGEGGKEGGRELKRGEKREVDHALTSLSLSLSPLSQAGTDRTGEVSGAYYMRYLNMTFTDALYIDNHVQDRDM